jgi:hypothetical protein
MDNERDDYERKKVITLMRGSTGSVAVATQY